MKKSYLTSKYFFRIVLVLVIAHIVFFWCGSIVKSHIKNPEEKDFKAVSYKTFEKQIKEDKLSVIYYTEGIDNVYIETKDKKLERVGNVDTDKFKNLLLTSTAKSKKVEDLEFKKDVYNNKMGMYGLGLACVYIWAIVYLCNTVNMYTDVDGNISMVKRKKKKKLVGGGTSANAKVQTKEDFDDSYKTFRDIAGLTEVKKDMKCLVDFLVNKDKYMAAGAKLPKGVILYGPPGTGKTLLAKAVANEADVPFIYMSGSEFIEMYVGVGAKRVRELFEKARKNAPCIIFIDEIDAIGGKRTEGDNGEDRKTINALLTEMDGFKESDNIIVVAATNRIEDLDPALLRPGRFTDKFCVPLPGTAEERLEVLQVYTRNKRLADNVDLKALAKETVGYSPAKLEALLNEAAIISVQKGRIFINKDDIENAMFKQLLSGHVKENQEKRKHEELELVAWHEAGHALVGKLFGKEVTKVTILASTSGAGGVTFSTPKTGLLSRDDIKHEIMQLYAGRIGELLYYDGDENKVTTGASNDINEATKLLHAYVTEYAMNKEIGMINLGTDSGSSAFLREKEIDLAKELEEETLKVLTKEKDKLSELASLLLNKETIYARDLNDILETA